MRGFKSALPEGDGPEAEVPPFAPVAPPPPTGVTWVIVVARGETPLVARYLPERSVVGRGFFPDRPLHAARPVLASASASSSARRRRGIRIISFQGRRAAASAWILWPPSMRRQLFRPPSRHRTRVSSTVVVSALYAALRGAKPLMAFSG